MDKNTTDVDNGDPENSGNAVDAECAEEFDYENNSSVMNSQLDLFRRLLQKLFDDISNVDSDMTVIILYHPRLLIEKDGNLNITENRGKIQQFSDLCDEYNIRFIDMSNRFIDEYNKDYILPYGFANTSVGVGHLNKYGHSMISDELYKMISEVD